jgi:hypothetical protein
MLKSSGYRRLLLALASAMLLFLFAAFAGLGPSALAQSATPSNAQPSSANQSSTDQSSPEKSDETLKVNVNVVGVFFNVKDKHGALIPNQKKEDFEVFEDGKPQTIKYFTAESNLPLTLGILIDSSGSQARVLDMEKEVGGAFLRQILTDKDEAFVIDFNVESELVPIHNAPGTVLYDAVYLSAHDMLASEVGRKSMILLTDGEDEGSKLKIRDAIEAAQKADAIVYVLLCADRGGYYSMGMSYTGEGEMQKLTEATGGRVINVGNKFDKLKEAFDQIAAELRSQYNIGYTSTNPVLDGSYRKLQIKSKEGYKIQTRAGYYATAHNQQQ